METIQRNLKTTTAEPCSARPVVIFEGVVMTVPDGMSTYEFMKELRG